MFISAAGALTVRHLKTNSPTIITLNVDLYFIVFSFHSFGFMINFKFYSNLPERFSPG